MFQSKKDIVYVVLAGIFITNAVVAELVGGKLIDVGPAVMSIGILPWPVVFVTTDLINEYFGEKGVRKLSFITGLTRGRVPASRRRNRTLPVSAGSTDPTVISLLRRASLRSATKSSNW